MSSRNAPDGTGPRRRHWSLAVRLTAWHAGAAFAVVLAATGALYWALAASLEREDEDELADQVRVLRAALAEPGGGLAAARRQAEWGWAARRHARVHARILDAAGRAELETPGMAGALPAAAFPDPLPPDAEPGTGQDVRAADGKPFRVLAASAGPPGGPAYIIQAGLDLSPEEELLADYRRNLWLVLGVALAACAAGGYGLARRGIRPVRDVADAARRVRAATLGERLVTEGLPSELADLADTFNNMLSRLEDSFGRLARFSADIAHELRTPVNNLRAEAEVALGRPRAPDEYREALGSCLEECDRLARLIDSLLFLARAENPKTQVGREPLDVGRELEAVRAFYEAAAAEAGVELTVEAPAHLVAELSRPLVQRAVGNLVANALAHTPSGGRVILSAAREAGAVRLEVVDTGRGIAPQHLPHLFDRFYRVDGARSAAGGGVGLGLAIVRGIAELHGGTAAVASELGRGTRVTLLLPAPPAGAAARCRDDETVISPS